jgi:N-acetylneuraminic acid mutarotase
VQVYNPTTNSWSTKAKMLYAISGQGNNGAVAIAGKIYVPGGATRYTTYKTLEVYKPATNTWTLKAALPVPAGDGASGGIKGRLYVIGRCLEGGIYCTDVDPDDPAARDRAFQRYNPVTDAWTILALPPAPSWSDRTMAAGVINKKFYVIMAVTRHPFTGQLLTARVFVYDPATNSWAKRAYMPSPRFGAFAVVNNKLYVAGGGGTGRLDVYGPIANAWTRRASIPRVEGGLAGERVVVNGQDRFEVVGGARPGNNLQYIP